MAGEKTGVDVLISVGEAVIGGQRGDSGKAVLADVEER